VAFLTTRVRGPDVDDYKKLTRVIKYLRGTINLNLTLEADDAQIVKWWIDAAFATHVNYKSHTGGTMTTCFSPTLNLLKQPQTESDYASSPPKSPAILDTGANGHFVTTNAPSRTNGPQSPA